MRYNSKPSPTGSPRRLGLPGILLLTSAGLLLASWASSASAGTPEVYRKAWNDPAVVKRIDENIERYRKGDAVVEVVNAQGAPVAGAKVSVTQQSHEFLFGCNLFVLGQLDTPEQNRKYEEAFLKLFNFATIPFYWRSLEPEPGQVRFQEGSPRIWRRPPPDRLIKWCKKNGVTAKGHPLLWHASKYNPTWMPKDAEELKRLYQKRFRQIAERYTDNIAIWDVVNESLVCSKSYPLYSEDRAYVPWAFKQVQPLFKSDNVLMINEVTSVSHEPLEKNRYLPQVTSLVEKGVGVEGIGFQFHFFGTKSLQAHLDCKTLQPKVLLDVYDRFGQFGLPLFVTEITVATADGDGPQVQAEVARNLYRLWFSAPRMAGITWWNLGDGLAVKGENNARGGLLDEELDPKPSYQVLDQLINHQWKTKLTGKTDAQGRLKLRGFLGTYKVCVETAQGKDCRELALTSGAASSWKIQLKGGDSQ